MFRISVLLFAVFGIAEQAENEATRTFEKWSSKLKMAHSVEANVVQSTTLKVLPEGKPPETILDEESRVHLTLQAGNRCHLVLTEVAFSQRKEPRTVFSRIRKEVVSNGTTLRFSWPESSETPLVWMDEETPKDWNESLRRGLERLGTGRGFGVHAMHDDRRTPKDGTWAVPDPLAEPSQLELKGHETIGDRETLVIQYWVALDRWHGRSKPRKHRVTLWLDAASFLPLKRTNQETHGGFESTTTEMFESLAIDGEIPQGSFDLPKDSMLLAPKPAPLGEAEIAAEIKGALRLLESDDPKERETGQHRLGRLGYSALAPLEAYLRAGDPEIRGRVAAAMDRIHGTDPLFLARPSLRLTSVHLKKSPLTVALRETFRPFLVSPEVETHAGGDIPAALTVDLDHAMFWEAILGFKSVTSAFFIPERLLFCDHSAFGRFSLSKADGPFLSTGHLERDERKAILRIRLLMEPGWLPIDATFSISSIRDADGKELLPLFENHLKEDPEAKTFGEEVERRPPDHGSACPNFLVASLKADSGKLPVGVRLTVQGLAKVRIPTAVQSAEFRIQGFKGDEERAIGEHRIRATQLTVRSKDIQYKTGSSGPKGWKPPQEKSYQNELWLVLADDEGRSIYRGREAYSSSGTRSSGANWPFESAPTRLCYVRPMDAEVREINVLIEGIEGSKD